MPRVLISDAMSPLAADVFHERGIEVDERTGLSADQLAELIGDYDGLAVRSATKVRADVIGKAGALKVIGRAGIGVDNIDIPAATAAGIVVMNAPFGNAITTAEHAVAMMFAVARQIGAANTSTHAGKWEKSRFMGMELSGKCLGIIGCGNIGSIVADRAQGLKMHVVSFDPYLSSERAADLGTEKLDLDDLFARADLITLHTPLTETTRDIINRDSIAKMRRGVFIINCARGGLVVEQDLKDALEAGQVAGAAMDVFVEEPAKENILFGMDQVVVTPHLGASTTEAQEKVAVQIAEQMSDYLLNGAVTNAINMPSVSSEEAPRLKPYMSIVRQFGSLLGQLADGAIVSVAIEYEGTVTTLNTKPLTALALEGLLSRQLENVNMINAPMIAEERNIGVSEVTRSASSDYQTMVRLRVGLEGRELSIAGTLYSDQHPRVVELNGIAVEAELGANMLYVTNEDKPGFIGRLGTTLGDAGVNIATFNLGRSTRGGEALALIELDEPIPDNVLDAVRALPYVREAMPLVR